MSTKRKISMLLLASMLVLNPLQTTAVSAKTITGPVVTSNPASEPLNKAIFANGKYYAVGGDDDPGDFAIMYSSVDATTWNPVTISDGSGGAHYYDIDYFKDIKYANGVYIAVGASYGIGVTVARSTDGVNWTSVKIADCNVLNSVEFAPNYVCGQAMTPQNVWVACGANSSNVGATYTSTDNGVTWTEVVSGGPVLNGVVLANGDIWAVGMGSTIIKYEDDFHMTAISNSIGQDLDSIRFVNGKFVALSNYGGVYTSTNGTAWSNVNLGTAGAQCLYSDIAYGNNQYVISGASFGSGWKAVAIVSSDFVNWEQVVISNTGSTLKSIMYANSKFTMTDDFGAVYSTTFVPEVGQTTSGSIMDVNKIDKAKLPYNSNLKVGTVVQCVYLDGVVQYTVGKNGTINNLKVIQ